MAKATVRHSKGYGWGYNAPPEAPRELPRRPQPRKDGAGGDYANDRRRGYCASDDDYGPQIPWEEGRRRK